MSADEAPSPDVTGETRASLVMFMYLAEDAELVRDLLAECEVVAFSDVELEGHGAGAPGWLGRVAPYRSRMSFAVVLASRAAGLLAAVRGLEGAHHEHPVRAVQLSVEDIAP